MAKSPTWSTDPSDLLRVGPDFDLADFDPAATPGWEHGRAEADVFRAQRGALLAEMQERLFANGKFGSNRAALLVVQGLDTAGKGGIVRHVAGMMDPQGLAIRGFGVPTPEEQKHHYLWRVRRSLPGPGKVGVFDRSHYEEVLVVRVNGEDHDWQKRFAEINRFEKRIVASGTEVVKVALMVSKQEQGLRLMERLDRPDKHWKYNPGDVDTRAKWDDYIAAYQDMLVNTSTEYAPWHVIPADNKWYARLAVTELLTQALARMELDWPKPRWQVPAQKRRLAATMDAETLELADDERPELLEDVASDYEEYTAAVEAVNALAEIDASAPRVAEAVEVLAGDDDAKSKKKDKKKTKKDKKDEKKSSGSKDKSEKKSKKKDKGKKK